MSKRFTLAEAQRLIPQVDRMLRDAVAIKTEYDEAESSIQSLTERVMMMGGMVVDRSVALESRNRRDSAAGRLRAAIQEVQEIGCIVKDLDSGLIDFPTLFRGVEVYMCWKLGEPAIGFWHGVDEGFKGRKAIDQDFRDHHKGERPQ
ncbi:MAG TPA: DUF2203 domain-containing protein [Bryobacteraceae bacterium]|nr:DUF2203 domain-containing protein [Bryobacteraceae bacterium]